MLHYTVHVVVNHFNSTECRNEQIQLFEMLQKFNKFKTFKMIVT